MYVADEFQSYFSILSLLFSLFSPSLFRTHIPNTAHDPGINGHLASEHSASTHNILSNGLKLDHAVSSDP